MSKLKLFSIFSVILCALTLTPLYSNAKDNKDSSNDIAVIDVQKVLQDSSAAQNIREQIKKKRDEYQADISKQEESLRNEEKKLSEQKTILAEKAFNKKQDEFKEKIIKVQRDVQEKRTALDKSLSDSLGKIQEVVLKIIADIAQEKKFKIAIPSSQVMYAQDNLDITDEVLKRLNEKLPKVEVQAVPSEPRPAPSSSTTPQKTN